MEVDMSTQGFERIVPHDSTLDVISNDLLFGEGPVWNSKTGEEAIKRKRFS